MKVRCAMPVNIDVKSHDYEWRGWGKTDLNAKRRKDGESKCLNKYVQQIWTLELKKDGGTERQAGQWLWMSKWRHGSEHQIEEDGGGFKCQIEYKALNA